MEPPPSMLSPAQIALACIVVKTKPIGVELDEHIRRLRQSIVTKSTEGQDAPQRQLSGALYWKQACGRLEVEKIKLQNRIFELERSQRQEKDGLGVDDGDAVTVTTTNKRGLEGKQNVAANTRSKRRKLNVSSDRENSSENDEEFDVTSNGSGGLLASYFGSHLADAGVEDRTLLRELYHLRQVTSGDKISRSETNDAISLICQAILKLFLAACQSGHARDPGERKDKVEEICTVVRKVWRLMLNALTTNEGGTECSTTVTEPLSCIAHMVEVFRQMLSQFQHHCNQTRDSSRDTNQMRPSRGFNCLNAAEISPIQADFDLRHSKAITMTMCSMFSPLRTRQLHHRKVFEGLACILLDQLGSALSLVVLGDTGNSSNSTRNNAQRYGSKNDTELDTESIRIGQAAPFVVSILRAMLAASDREGNERMAKDSLAITTNRHHERLMLSNMRAKLQQTLLRSVYGDDDETFDEALSRADEPDISELDSQIKTCSKDNTAPEWFVSQLWEHLGWDILVDNRFGT